MLQLLLELCRASIARVPVALAEFQAARCEQ
jgi:hypothetical protein